MRKNFKPIVDSSKKSTQRRYHWKEFEEFMVLSCKFFPSFRMYIHRHRKRIVLYIASFDLLIWYIDFKIGTCYLLFILSKSKHVSQQASRTLSQIVNCICYNPCEKKWNCLMGYADPTLCLCVTIVEQEAFSYLHSILCHAPFKEALHMINFLVWKLHKWLCRCVYDISNTKQNSRISLQRGEVGTHYTETFSKCF